MSDKEAIYDTQVTATKMAAKLRTFGNRDCFLGSLFVFSTNLFV